MVRETNKIITATNTITTFRKFKGLMIDLLRGYPQYIYFGKFESVFKENGKKIVDLLVRHDIIEKISKKEVEKRIKTMTSEELEKIPKGEEGFIWYRLCPRGIDIAISLINLEYGEKVLEHSKQTLSYSKEMRFFTVTIIVIAILTFGLGALTFYFQFLR